MKEEAIEILKIHGFSLRTNTLYQIMPKHDFSAPDYLKEIGSTKYPSAGIKNIEPGAIYNEHMRVWDNGLFLDSPLLKSIVEGDDKIRKAALTTIEKNILKPLENISGAGSYSHTSDVWVDYMIDLYEGKIINTSDPKELLDLYLCLADKRLTPEDREKDPEFISSQYIIVDKELAVDFETKQVLNGVKAMSSFGALKSSNKTSLVSVLKFIGINCTDKTDETSLTIAFSKFINHPKDSVKNTDKFLETVDKFSTEEGQDLIFIFNSLKDLVSSGKFTQRGNGDIFLGSDFIGNNYLSAAENIQKDKKLFKDFRTFLS